MKLTVVGRTLNYQEGGKNICFILFYFILYL